MMLGIVVMTINNMFTEEEIVIVNTVHDSIVFDAANVEIATEAAIIIGNIMADAPAMFKYFFGVEFDLGLPVEVTFGPSWKEQSLYKEEFS